MVWRRMKLDRRGAASIETVVVLLVVVTLSVGMFDLGMGVFRHNILSQAARQGARLAIVHGALASQLGTWGPTSYSAKGDSLDAIPTAMRRYLAGVKPSTVTITVAWPDGGNEPGDRVQVTMSTTYSPVFKSLFKDSTFNLSASSTLAITH